MIYYVLGSVVYCFTDNYPCINYLCLQQAKIYLENKVFENTTFNDISEIIIPELLMNSMSCHGFVNKRSQLSFCYVTTNWLIIIFQKVLLLFKNPSALIDVPLR